MTDTLKAIYNPTTGKVACVLLQAALRGSRQVSNLFDPSDWELAPVEGQAMMEATLDQWKFIASLDREERVERFRSRRKGER